MTARPSPAVLRAFGADAEPEPLSGGQGTAWRAGGVVLKPLDRSEEELAWEDSLLLRVRQDGFRLAGPLRSAGGSLAVDGCCASTHLPGRHEPRRWVAIVAAGERLHAALAGEPRPDLLDRRSDHWAVADRIAFGELAAGAHARDPLVARLLAARRPLRAPSQLVHGDLTGNVLFAPDLPPAILDLSPYWRPPGFAAAVVVADALVFEGADESLVDELAHVEELPQQLLRALLFRLLTDRLARAGEPIGRPDPYAPAVRLACRLTAGS